MRFGWLAAAAAMVCAMPAEAQTFIRYEVTGSGIQYNKNSAGQFTGQNDPVAFTVTFSALSSAGSYYLNGGQNFVGDGSSFSGSIAGNGLSNYNINGNAASSGVLSYSDLQNAPSYGRSIDLTANYMDTDGLGGFPSSAASSSASGTLRYGISNFGFGGNFLTYGTLSSFAVLGSSSTFQPYLVFQSYVASVPEPATWLMLICGIGLIGFALRRRDHTGATMPHSAIS